MNVLLKRFLYSFHYNLDLSTQWGVLCICQRPFHVCPPSLRCGSQTAWLSWAGQLIGRGPAASLSVSGGVSPRRLEEGTDLLSPTQAENSSSSPRPHPSREICRWHYYLSNTQPWSMRGEWNLICGAHSIDICDCKTTSSLRKQCPHLSGWFRRTHCQWFDNLFWLVFFKRVPMKATDVKLFSLAD